jgi:hypothetical protein
MGKKNKGDNTKEEVKEITEVKEDTKKTVIMKEQAYSWKNETDVNVSVTAFNGEDEKVHAMPALKPGYEFKCVKPYSYIVIDKPKKQTFYVGSDIKKNNMSLKMSAVKVFSFE